MSKFKYRHDIIDHKEKVGKNLLKIQTEIGRRMYSHDNDKIANDTIFEVYEQYNSKLRNEKYDSPEFLKYAKIMRPAVQLHTSKNRHHFYDKSNQIKNEEVDLIDLIEVLCDWIGATERNPNIDFKEALEYNFEKYNIPKEWRIIMLNTYINYLKKE
jgi:hypothetical protein